MWSEWFGIGSIIAHITQKHLFIVRKNIVDCHSKYTCETPEVVKRYIIIDDVIESGNTILRMKKEVEYVFPTAVCNKIFLYNEFTIMDMDDAIATAETFKEMDTYRLSKPDPSVIISRRTIIYKKGDKREYVLSHDVEATPAAKIGDDIRRDSIV